GTDGNIILANLRGKVGIGTSSPTALLHVEAANSTGNGAGVIIKGQNAIQSGSKDYIGGAVSITGVSGQIYGLSGGVNLTAGSASTGGFGASLNLAPVVYQSAGKASLLGGNGWNGNGSVTIQGGTSPTAGYVLLQPTNGGNVGIGTTIPNWLLHLGTISTGTPTMMAMDNTDTTNGNGANLSFRGTTTGTGATSLREFASIQAVYGEHDHATASGSLRFWTRSNGPIAERMRIDTTGNVGIGTSSPGYKLQVGVAADGSEARANAWNTLSDERLKRDFEIIPDSLEKILQLNGYYYFWNRGSDTAKKMGVKAQEVEKVFPEVVSHGSDGYLSVSYNHLVAGVIEAVKEFYHKWLGGNVAIHKELALKADKLEVEQRLSQSNKEIERKLASKEKEISSLKKENALIKSYLCSKDPKAVFCK
ncbi:MAG: tail fiber domain-containing protein, partial [Bdellovibrionales bacterium]|nr:tail fiber domain-containing protein [Bdellovibrionales bacterium]